MTRILILSLRTPPLLEIQRLSKQQLRLALKLAPVNSRNMVTGVLNDSTNQPTKGPKQQRASSEQTKERPSTSVILFAPQPQTFPSANLLPMPKGLTASLPVFDGKSEKFELFEDLFRNNFKMYPHLTEIQKRFTSTHCYEETHSKRTVISTTPKKIIRKKS